MLREIREFMAMLVSTGIKRLSLPFFAAALCVATAVPSSAQNMNIYTKSGDPDNASYAVALKGMMDLYKNDGWHFVDGELVAYPLIGFFETNLDGKGYNEIIAYPDVEEEHEDIVCKNDGNDCPHYILQIDGKRVKQLGKIYAVTVELGDKQINGFNTLKAYSLYTPTKKTFTTYAYNPKTQKYEPK